MVYHLFGRRNNPRLYHGKDHASAKLKRLWVTTLPNRTLSSQSTASSLPLTLSRNIFNHSLGRIMVKFNSASLSLCFKMWSSEVRSTSALSETKWRIITLSSWSSMKLRLRRPRIDNSGRNGTRYRDCSSLSPSAKSTHASRVACARLPVLRPTSVNDALLDEKSKSHSYCRATI